MPNMDLDHLKYTRGLKTSCQLMDMMQGQKWLIWKLKLTILFVKEIFSPYFIMGEIFDQISGMTWSEN